MRQKFEGICYRTESKKRCGPTQAATVNHNQHLQYTNSLHEQIAALGLKAPVDLPWYQSVNCTAIDNDQEDTGEVYITHRGASILDHSRARQLEVYR